MEENERLRVILQIQVHPFQKKDDHALDICEKSKQNLRGRCTSANEAYIFAKEAYISAKEAYISADEACISRQKDDRDTFPPKMSSRAQRSAAPCISAKDACISTKETCVSATEAATPQDCVRSKGVNSSTTMSSPPPAMKVCCSVVCFSVVFGIVL